MLGEDVIGAERLCDRLADERRVAERCEADPEDAGLELRHELGRRFDRKPRLARAARAGQREQSRTVSEQRCELPDFSLPADERGRRPRQVGVGDGL